MIILTCLPILGQDQKNNPPWMNIISRYKQADTPKSIWQIINSLGTCHFLNLKIHG